MRKEDIVEFKISPWNDPRFAHRSGLSVSFIRLWHTCSEERSKLVSGRHDLADQPYLRRTGCRSAAGTILEMVLVQLTINLRYSLMALSLSQKLDPKFTTGHRLLASYGITDEIFAVCSAQKELLSPAYMYGMILVATIGWVTGTLLGATAGAIVPGMVSAALGILLYGMFIAIIVPPAKKDKSVLAVVIAAALFSLLFKYVFTAVSGGFAIIICAVCASALGAVFFPVKDEEEQS